MPVRQRVLISITNYRPLLLIGFAVLQRNQIWVAIALVVGGIDLTMHVIYWWLPYLPGATTAQKAEHARLFGETLTTLPSIGDNPIPNAQHVVVGILMLAMVLATVASAVAVFGAT